MNRLPASVTAGPKHADVTATTMAVMTSLVNKHLQPWQPAGSLSAVSAHLSRLTQSDSSETF